MLNLLALSDQILSMESINFALSQTDNIDSTALPADSQIAIDYLAKNDIDLLLIQISLSSELGINCVQAIREHYPDLKIMILSHITDSDFVIKVFSHAINAYILDDVSIEVLSQNILDVHNGGTVISPSIATIFMNQLSKWSSVLNDLAIKKQPNLASVEWKIIKLVSLGMSNEEIANALYLSQGTIRNYLSAVFQKLNLNNRTQLVVWFYTRKI